MFFTVSIDRFTLFFPPTYILCFIISFVLFLYFYEIQYTEKNTEISGCVASSCICGVSHVGVGSFPAPSCRGSNTCYLQVFWFFCKVIILLYHITVILRFPFCWEGYLDIYEVLLRVQVGLHHGKLLGASDCLASIQSLPYAITCARPWQTVPNFHSTFFAVCCSCCFGLGCWSQTNLFSSCLSNNLPPAGARVSKPSL